MRVTNPKDTDIASGGKSCSGDSKFLNVGASRTSKQVKGAKKQKLFVPCFPAQKCVILQYGEFSIKF